MRTSVGTIDIGAYEYNGGGTTLTGALSCDVGSQGAVTVVDVQLAINQALGIVPCATADLQQNGQCNVVDVQRVISTALGGFCLRAVAAGDLPGAAKIRWLVQHRYPSKP